MDEAGSRAFLQIKTPDEIIEQENTIRDLTEKKIMQQNHNIMN